MDEEEIIPQSGSVASTPHEQMVQYGMMAGYFVAVYLLCYLLCRLIRWDRMGRVAGVVQGLVLIAVVTALYLLWALRFTRIEEGYDLVKAFGLGFVTLLVAIGGCAHGEYGRIRRRRVVRGPGSNEPVNDLAVPFDGEVSKADES